MFGNNRSKSDRRTPQRWNPNLQHIKVNLMAWLKKCWFALNVLKAEE